MDTYEAALENDEIRNYNLVQKAILFSGGAKWMVLQLCSTEDFKFFIVGSAVLLTTLAAFISGSFAFSKVFGNIWLALALGLFWAVIIYNTDRSIIVSLNKVSKPAVTAKDWAIKITVTAFSILFRLGIAVFIAFTVEIPIELKLFDKTLADQRQRMSDAKQTASTDSIYKRSGVYDYTATIKNSGADKKTTDDKMDHLRETPYFKGLQNDINDAQQKVDQKRAELAPAISSYYAQLKTLKKQYALALDEPSRNNIDAEMTTVNGHLSGLNTQIAVLVQEKRRRTNIFNSNFKEQYDALKEQSATDAGQVKTAIGQKDKALKADAPLIDTAHKLTATRYDDNLVAELDALNRLKNDKEDGETYTNIGRGIRGVLILIELLPMMLKLFFPSGGYEHRLSTIEHLSEVDEKRKKKLKDDEYDNFINRHAEILTIRFNTEIAKENQLATERDNLVKRVLKKVTEYQNKLIDKYITAWYQKQELKADANVDDYLKDENK